MCNLSTRELKGDVKGAMLYISLELRGNVRDGEATWEATTQGWYLKPWDKMRTLAEWV